METTQAPRNIAAFKPGLNAADAEAVRSAIESGWTGSGVYVRLFERRIARAAGARHALAVNSGTAALHLALKRLGVEGGEVVTTPLSSPATSHAVLYNGATPVFVDVEDDTGNLDPRLVAKRLTSRTRAIIAVHFNGHSCDMDALLALARRRGVPLLEDAGAALPRGGSYRGRPLGSMGDLACFSFSRKNFTTMDGGAVVYARAQDAARFKRLRNLGQEEGAAPGERSRSMSELGYPYRMNDLSAAIGLSQFDRWEATAKRLARIESLYRDRLADARGLELPIVKSYARRSPACFPVRARAGKRAFRAFLLERGIRTDDWLVPHHWLTLYKPYARALPVAERLAAELVYLPFYPSLTDDEADRVASAARAFKK